MHKFREVIENSDGDSEICEVGEFWRLAMQLCRKQLIIPTNLLLYCIVSVSYMMLTRNLLVIAKFLVVAVKTLEKCAVRF